MEKWKNIKKGKNMKNYIIDIKYEVKEEIDEEMEKKLEKVSHYILYFLSQYGDNVEIDILKREC